MTHHLKRAGLRMVIPVDAARRKFLIAFGIAYLGIGFSYIFASPTASVRQAFMWAPLPFWILGVVWVVAGVVAGASSFMPTTRDKPGFLMLSVPPTLWAVGYFVAWVLPWFGGYSTPRAWVSVIVFGVIAFAVDVVSGMVDATLVKQVVETSESGL